ncbi:MAG: hypothetical protein V2B18_20750 [Pseudomonadota bacterium]
MKPIVPTITTLTIMAVLALSTTASAEGFNPYLPTNAVAAEPAGPYNQWEICKVSRIAYPPCLSCGGVALPDVPPVDTPFKGPFGIPVSVP